MAKTADACARLCRAPWCVIRVALSLAPYARDHAFQWRSQPKGGVIAVNLLAAIWPHMRYGVGLDAQADLFWPTGDPGWGYGLCCYLAALAMGRPCFRARRTPAPRAFCRFLNAIT